MNDAILQRRRWVQRVLGFLAASVLLLVVGGGQAFAKNEFHNWNSQSNPLTVSGYGSVGHAYGAWRVTDGSNGTGAWNDGHANYSNADNHKVYIEQTTLVNAGICYAPQYTSCTQAYYTYAIVETAHSNVQAWHDAKSSTLVPASADYARGAMRVCLDIPARIDPCSGQAITTGTYY